MKAYEDAAKYLGDAVDSLDEALDVLADTDLASLADTAEVEYAKLRTLYRLVRDSNRTSV